MACLGDVICDLSALQSENALQTCRGGGAAARLLRSSSQATPRHAGPAAGDSDDPAVAIQLSLLAEKARTACTGTVVSQARAHSRLAGKHFTFDLKAVLMVETFSSCLCASYPAHETCCEPSLPPPFRMSSCDATLARPLDRRPFCTGSRIYFSFRRRSYLDRRSGRPQARRAKAARAGAPL